MFYLSNYVYLLLLQAYWLLLITHGLVVQVRNIFPSLCKSGLMYIQIQSNEHFLNLKNTLDVLVS